MKKIFAILALAAMTLTMSAQSFSIKFGKKKSAEKSVVKSAEKAAEVAGPSLNKAAGPALNQSVAPAQTPAQAASAAEGMVTYDGKDFSVQHPKEYADVIDDWAPGVVNEWKKDDKHKLTVWAEEEGQATEATLKEWGTIMKDNYEAKDIDWEVDEPVINGKVLTMRMEADGMVQYYYTIVVGGSFNFTGTMSFLASEEAHYKPIFDAVIASIKKK